MQVRMADPGPGRLADPMMNRNASYLALTRHRHGVQVYSMVPRSHGIVAALAPRAGERL
jgi:ATP-dependent exoDNAse (exonuclease V) alpha subunit